jgi:hypothetical protein
MTSNKIVELKKLFAQSEIAHAISVNDDIDEDVADQAYIDYWQYLRAIATEIAGLINVDEKTALKMAAHKSAEIMSLLERAKV